MTNQDNIYDQIKKLVDDSNKECIDTNISCDKVFVYGRVGNEQKFTIALDKRCYNQSDEDKVMKIKEKMDEKIKKALQSKKFDCKLERVRSSSTPR